MVFVMLEWHCEMLIEAVCAAANPRERYRLSSSPSFSGMTLWGDERRSYSAAAFLPLPLPLLRRTSKSFKYCPV
jgi:hypothetical protein